jgi:hypothetical protein
MLQLQIDRINFAKEFTGSRKKKEKNGVTYLAFYLFIIEFEILNLRADNLNKIYTYLFYK